MRLIGTAIEGDAMSIQMRGLLASGFDHMRFEPTSKRIQAVLGGVTVVDSTRAMLVWEPRRVVASYAVPVDDVRGSFAPAALVGTEVTDAAGVSLPAVDSRPVLDPSVPFTVHSAGGQVVDLLAADHSRPGAGYLPADADLAGYVILDFGALDSWYEEDEVNVAHPKDPFHRIDVLASSRQVTLEMDGQILAESARPMLLFETMLPTRYYVPREDIKAELIPSSTRTYCAYKGQASYWSVAPGGDRLDDIAWTYEDPLHDATQVRGLVSFFDERIDVTLDGVRLQRPATPWSAGPGT
jgi:uncharacterized protein (DUF427 family)